MRVLVFGLGALGHVFATMLQKAGHEVIGIGRSPIIEVIRKNGIQVSGIWGEHKANLKGVYTCVSELPSQNFDLIVLTVKSYDIKTAVKSVKSLVAPDTLIMCVQNGYGNYKIASEILDASHIVLARVIFGAELLAPGKVKVTVCADDVIVGSPKQAISAQRLQKLASLFNQAGIPTRFSPDIVSYVWDKILYNCALNPLGAILEVNYGVLGEVTVLKTIMNEIVKEIFVVAKARHVPLFWPSAEAYLDHFYTKLLPSTAAHRPSMLQDIQKGKRTEINALNGAIVRLGKDVGIETPINSIITYLIKGKEQICSQRQKN